MRLVSMRQEAHHRGYFIEGLKQGEGLLLRVTPTRPGLPTLKYSRFWTLRGSWVKAVGVVVGYIDEAFNDAPHKIPPDQHDGAAA
jgi:hypothetical protein